MPLAPEYGNGLWDLPHLAMTWLAVQLHDVCWFIARYGKGATPGQGQTLSEYVPLTITIPSPYALLASSTLHSVGTLPHGSPFQLRVHPQS